MKALRAPRGRRLTAALGLVMCAGPAMAETCVFTQECFEAEACAETQFEMSVEGDRLVTDAETIPVSSGGSEDVQVFVGYTASAFHVLTRQKAGEARYTTHIFDGPLMVNYLGACN